MEPVTGCRTFFVFKALETIFLQTFKKLIFFRFIFFLQLGPDKTFRNNLHVIYLLVNSLCQLISLVRVKTHQMR